MAYSPCWNLLWELDLRRTKEIGFKFELSR
jgi:hypothetical protein